MRNYERANLEWSRTCLVIDRTKQFEADIDFPAESVLFGVNNCQVN